MSGFGFLYEICGKDGKAVLTQSITGDRMDAMLKHIAQAYNEQEYALGLGNASINVLKARLDENTSIVDPKRLESLSVLVTMATEHYRQKAGKLVVENVTPPKPKIVEDLKKVLTNQKRTQKLIESTKKLKLTFPSYTKIPACTSCGKKISTGAFCKKCRKDRDVNPEKYGLKNELELPNLDKGDVLLAGKFKNKRVTIDGFKTDEHNQPVATTDKGDVQIFRPRIEKLINQCKLGSSLGEC